MALLAATLTAIDRRWGVLYIAQLSQRDLFDATNPPFDARDDDVVERAVLQSIAYAQTRVGILEEGDARIIELVPYFLVPAGEQSDALLAAFNIAQTLLVSPPATTATTALEKGDDDDRRRFDGDDFEDLTDIQRASRPRRGTY